MLGFAGLDFEAISPPFSLLLLTQVRFYKAQNVRLLHTANGLCPHSTLDRGFGESLERDISD